MGNDAIDQHIVVADEHVEMVLDLLGPGAAVVEDTDDRLGLTLGLTLGKRDSLDDAPRGVRDEDPASRVDALQQHHRQIPPAVLADKVSDEP